MKRLLSADRLLHRFGAWLVAAVALAYYAQYYRAGLNFGGEAGTDAVIATRLLMGQRPIVDTFLGYNVMWFYPISWLFHLTGPDYLAMRIYFFAIGAVTGLMAFFVIRRATGSGIWAVPGACLPVLLPGMISRNYMAFLAVLNMLTLLNAYVFEQPTRRRRILWMVANGLALALTWLMRIDLGMFFTVIQAGLVVLYALGRNGRALWVAFTGAVLSVVCLVALHAPVYFDAAQRGYLEPFLSQYKQWAPFVAYLAKAQIDKPAAPVVPAQMQPQAGTEFVQTVPLSVPMVKKDVAAENYQGRPPLSALWDLRHWKARFFATAIYLPLLVALLAVLPATFVLFAAIFRRRETLRAEALTVLISTGAALTLFPQYFFFRPDISHLADFMAAFMPAMFCSSWIAVRVSLGAGWVARGYAAVFAALCLWSTGVYLAAGLPKEGTGGIAAVHGRNCEFVGRNGVRVLLTPEERDATQALCTIITGASKSGEYVICYPYGATVGFMTDRPSYEYNLYVDNASNVANFNHDALDRLRTIAPPVVVIDNIDINGTEESRFKNWAAPVYNYIRDHYDYRGTYRRQEIYVRRAAQPPTQNQP